MSSSGPEMGAERAENRVSGGQTCRPGGTGQAKKSRRTLRTSLSERSHSSRLARVSSEARRPGSAERPGPASRAGHPEYAHTARRTVRSRRAAPPRRTGRSPRPCVAGVPLLAPGSAEAQLSQRTRETRVTRDTAGTGRAWWSLRALVAHGAGGARRASASWWSSVAARTLNTQQPHRNYSNQRHSSRFNTAVLLYYTTRSIQYTTRSGSVAERLARWTQAQKGPGSNRSRDAVG